MALVNLKPSQRGITVLIVITAVIFIGCVFGCLGALKKLNGIQAELAAKEKQVSESNKIAQTQRESQTKYEDASNQLRYLESSVSTQAYVPTLLKQVEYLGESVNLKMLGVRPQAPDPSASMTKKAASTDAAGESGASSADGSSGTAQQAQKPKPYDELKIDLELEGQYMNALDFLYRLTTFPKIIAVNSVQMSPAGNKSTTGSPCLDIRISITAFVLKSSEPAPGSSTTPASAVSAAAGEGRTGNEAG